MSSQDLEIVFDLVSEADRVTTKKDLERLTAEACRVLDVQVLLGLEVVNTTPRLSAHVTFGTASQAWRERYCEAGHLRADPLVIHTTQSLQTISWSELTDQGPAEPAREVAKSLGIAEAIIFPQGRLSTVARAILVAGGSQLATAKVRTAAAVTAGAMDRAATRVLAEARRTDASTPRLSRREVETLYWVARGLRDKAIGVTMKLAPSTVAGYIRSAQAKLGVSGRLAASRRAEELGLLPHFISMAA